MSFILKGHNMYVIKRTDKDSGGFTVEHPTLEETDKEAERLAIQHVMECPEFTIYELVEVRKVTAKVEVSRKYKAVEKTM